MSDERGRPTGAAARTPSAAPLAPPLGPGSIASVAPPQRPVALLYGPGHKVVHANPAFVAEFGIIPIGVPTSEALLDLPPIVLDVADRVLASGRPLATWIAVRGIRRRLTVAPRVDIETGEVYGVAIRLATE